jgi:hypothetical protein
MRRALAATLLAACGADDPVLQESPRAELTFEVLHVGIEGPHTYPSERLGELAGALDESPAHVICLQGIWRPEDRAALASALSPTFPYSLELATDDSTLVDDPTAADGTLPPLEMEPACNANDEVIAGKVLGCLLVDCVEGAGADAVVITPECLAPGTTCGNVLDEAVSATDERQRCRACVLSHVYAGDSVEGTRDRCRDLPGNPLAHGGQHGMMLLSKLPISAPSLHVLPAEGVRRAVISATVTSDHGALDVYCATLGPAELGLPGDIPTSEAYPGPYGDPQAGWRVEQELQVDKLLTHVRARSGALPAVVLGNFGTSEAVTADGEVVIAGSAPTSLQRLLASYGEAGLAGSSASCTACALNRMLPSDTFPSLLNHIFLSGMPSAEVRESSRVYLGNVVEVAPRDWNPLVTRVPLSLQYGLRSSVSYEEK